MSARLVNTQSSINNFFNTAFSIMREEIVKGFAKLGEECVARVRDREQVDSWIDRTGNLRSSIGYAVYDYGEKMIESAFPAVKGGTEGSAEGQKMVSELASEYSKVYALVVVAGMNYADFVEAKENKDVLASTELWAKSVVDRRLQNAVDKALERINKISI